MTLVRISEQEDFPVYRAHLRPCPDEDGDDYTWDQATPVEVDPVALARWQAAAEAWDAAQDEMEALWDAEHAKAREAAQAAEAAAAQAFIDRGGRWVQYGPCAHSPRIVGSLAIAALPTEPTQVARFWCGCVFTLQPDGTVTCEERT